MALSKTSSIWDLLKWVGGATLIGVPALAAYAGHHQQDMETNLEKDKEFKAQQERLTLYDEAIQALAGGRS